MERRIFLDEGYVLISVYLFIYLFVCDSHNSKTTQLIFMIFGGMIGHNSWTIWLDFGSDWVKGQGQGRKKGLFAVTLSIFSQFCQFLVNLHETKAKMFVIQFPTFWYELSFGSVTTFQCDKCGIGKGMRSTKCPF